MEIEFSFVFNSFYFVYSGPIKLVKFIEIPIYVMQFDEWKNNTGLII